MANQGNDLLGANWTKFLNAMNDAHKTFHQKPITWKRATITTDRYGEDLVAPTTTVELLVLLNYNFMRTWPADRTSATGETDDESVQVMINKEYLRQNGYLNASGYFDFNPDLDRFIIDGLKYKPFGDTAAAQMQVDDVLITIILKRDHTQTGDKR